MKKRWFGDARIDSKWEKKLAETLFRSATFKPDKIDYKITKTYTPDFLVKAGVRDIYVEAKGRFRDRDEARKYIFIRDELDKQDKHFVFLFYDPLKPMPFAKKRKDGTKQTHAEWAEKNNFEYYTETDFPREWLE